MTNEALLDVVTRQRLRTSLPEVSLIFLTNGDRALLYLRDDKPEISYPNHWSLFGGHFEAGEAPLEALERELREEIGVVARNVRFLERIDAIDYPLCEDHIIYLFAGEVDASVDDLHLSEGQRLAYFTMEEFKTLRVPDFLRDAVLRHVE